VTHHHEPDWLYIATLKLNAVSSAASVGRVFVRRHLEYLGLSEQIEDAELVVSELVTNAVQAIGFPDPQSPRISTANDNVIGVQLWLLDNSLYVEVWDRSVELPVKQSAQADAEGGRGLALIEALSWRWGIFPPPAGGKVVWAELVVEKLPDPRDSVDDRPHLQRGLPQEMQPPQGHASELASVALMERVLTELGRL
jgi:anti-sigma regulatory factor (Ser/Thr protein kinase)